uniref:Glutathione S-transferase n=1 Tax=Ailuropoda melanoleuca TaxID=9646 RepID=A0A7N5JPN1_AILME
MRGRPCLPARRSGLEHLAAEASRGGAQAGPGAQSGPAPGRPTPGRTCRPVRSRPYPKTAKRSLTMAMILGYWDIRGVSEGAAGLGGKETHGGRKCAAVGTNTTRMFLLRAGCSSALHSGLSFSAPDYDRSQWLNEKFKLGLDFPNLPYLIDGAHKVTQSNAILRYIARKHNLCGETEEEKIRVDILENEVMDTRLYFARMCYNPDFEKLRPGYLEGLPDKLKLYSQFLGKRPWFAGEKLTYVDFLAYDILDLHRIFEPKSLEAFPNLKEFMARVEVIPLRLLTRYRSS